MNKRLYCDFCQLYPRHIVRRYTQPTEDILFWNDRTGVYEFNYSNHPCGIPEVDGVYEFEPETIDLCGMCLRKLTPVQTENVLESLFLTKGES